MYRLYTLILLLIAPLAIAHLLWRSLRQPAYRQRLGERFGRVSAAQSSIAIWVHAVSVGEALAARPLIERLIQRHGTGRVWVTSTTPTGSERVQSLLGNRVRHSYIPYDLPWAVERFLDTVRPSQVVIMETELWPNLFRSLQRRGIALTIANARLSPRSYRGYARFAALTRSVLGCTRLIAARGELDAGHFRALGAPQVETVGNLKFDIEPPAAQLDTGRQLRIAIGPDRPVWVAASTHDGEDQRVLEAHAALRARHPDALLILVPRHPQRFDDVARLLERQGLTHLRRAHLDLAQAPPQLASCSVLLGDSLGEMWMYLQAADVAFVGGSLVQTGGHNVLEPAALGRPVLFGPSMFNFLEARDLLLQEGAARQITDATELGKCLLEWFVQPATRESMGEAGRRAISANRGALERLLSRLDAND